MCMYTHVCWYEKGCKSLFLCERGHRGFHCEASVAASWWGRGCVSPSWLPHSASGYTYKYIYIKVGATGVAALSSGARGGALPARGQQA